MFAPLLSVFSPIIYVVALLNSHTHFSGCSPSCAAEYLHRPGLYTMGSIFIPWQKMMLNCMFPHIISGWVDFARKMCDGMIESGPQTSLAPTSAIKLLLSLLLVLDVVSSEEYFRKAAYVDWNVLVYCFLCFFHLLLQEGLFLANILSAHLVIQLEIISLKIFFQNVWGPIWFRTAG